MVIHNEKLRWLFWLRWKTFLRSFTRKGAARIIGSIFSTLFVLLVGGSIATATYFGYRFIPAPGNTELLFLVLTGIYIIWIVLPLLEININEGLDISKLALFPLTRGELMVSMVFSTLLDIPMLGLFLVFAAVIAGWAISVPLAIMALLTMIVFYIQLIAVSQLVLALLQPLVQSRRFRDLTILLTIVLASSGYLCQFAIRGLASKNFVDALLNATFSPYLQWLPPGMAARAIQQAYIGNWGVSFAWLGVLIVVSVAMLYLWQTLVERSLTTAETGGTVRRVRQRRTTSVALALPAGARGGLLPPPMAAMLNKDFKYIWRDPQIKALFLQSLVSVVVLIFVFAFPQTSSTRRGIAGPWLEFYAPNIVLLSIFTLAYNALGFERQSLTTLFLFPIKPQYILWGKNLLVFLIGIVEMLIIAVLMAFVTQAWDLLVPTLALGVSGIGVILAIGNFTTVYFPQRMRFGMRGFRSAANTSFEEGCLRSVTSMVALLVSAIVLLPAILALVWPWFSGARWIWTLSVPGAIIYGAIIYFVVTTLVASRMLDRAPEILAVVARE